VQPAVEQPASQVELDGKQTVAGGAQSASLRHDGPPGLHRPVYASQLISTGHDGAPLRAQPSTQVELSQTRSGGPQCASIVHGLSGMQRPLGASQIVLPRQTRPPGRPQPKTHWPVLHTRSGGPHSRSWEQRTA
jgi:hypothetical protein